MSSQTEYAFSLPYGYVDAEGETHREGRMRMATALDEIESVAHPRVRENEAYLPIVLLSRVITHLGTLPGLNLQVAEDLSAVDLAYLEDFYLRLNSFDGLTLQARCPQCGTKLHFTVPPLQEPE